MSTTFVVFWHKASLDWCGNRGPIYVWHTEASPDWCSNRAQIYVWHKSSLDWSSDRGPIYVWYKASLDRNSDRGPIYVWYKASLDWSSDRGPIYVWYKASLDWIIWLLGTNSSEILIEIHMFSFIKMYLKSASAKWWPFCLGLNVLSFPSLAHYHSLKRKCNFD